LVALARAKFDLGLGANPVMAQTASRWVTVRTNSARTAAEGCGANNQVRRMLAGREVHLLVSAANH
jgi:hypothetical protein